MNYGTAIKMIDESDRDLRDRILKHVAACPKCRAEIKKKDAAQ